MDATRRVAMQLVEKLTDKQRSDDADALRRLKQLCQQHGHSAVEQVFDLWLSRLKEKDSRVRFHALELAEELFRRSSVFRGLTASNVTEIFELTVAFRSGMSLPPPQQEAVQLRGRALECLERWSEQFGEIYPPLMMAHKYLRDVLQMKFPELRARAAAREAEAAARQERTRQINEERYALLKHEYVSQLAEMGVVMDEMEVLFALVEERPPQQPPEDEEWEDVIGGDVDGAASSPAKESNGGHEGPTLVAEPDPGVLETLRGSYRQLTNRHLATIQDWLRLVIKVDVGEPGSAEHGRRERILRAAIAGRDRILGVKAHHEKLMAQMAGKAAASTQLVISATSEDGGGQHVTASAIPAVDGNAQRRASGATATASRPDGAVSADKAQLIADVFGSDSDDDQTAHGAAGRIKTPARAAALAAQRPSLAVLPAREVNQGPTIIDPTYRQQPGAAAEPVMKEAVPLPARLKPEGGLLAKSFMSEDLKQKLLAEAPSIPHGTHLAYWDSDKSSLLNNKGMELYNHWGAVDEHVALPDHVISQFFTTRATYYEPGKAKPSQPPGNEKRRESPTADDAEAESPAKKRKPPVTAVGFGGVTNSSFAAMLRPPSKPKLPGLPSALPQRAIEETQPAPKQQRAGDNTATAEARPALEAAEAPDNDAAQTANQRDVHTRATAASGMPGSPAQSPAVERQDPKTTRTLSPGADATPDGRAAASRRRTQRALDRAHNEAVLASSGGDDEQFARNLAAHEYQALHPRKEARGKRKEAPSVRERLARKLLSGSATSRAIRDLDAVEDEHFKEQESRRW